ncbi:MAG: lysophospholipid acyltransferase family protein [Ahniella sp.]|nr:lysophospholipid acyltransferase family protein [Ahniella sp.]
MPYPVLSDRIFASLWRSHLLLRENFEVSLKDLEAFLDGHIKELGATDMDRIAAMPGGVILATPHYGAFITTCLFLIRRLHGRKRFNVIFNDPAITPSNAVYEPLFRRLGCDVNVLYPDRRGTLSALKALKRGECLAILPDVYLANDATIAVPFFGRLLRVMAGTAFFASRTGATILPLYGIPKPDMHVDLKFDEPLHIDSLVDADDKQTLFNVTAALAERMEQQLRAEPEHWNYWETMDERSTALGVFRTREELLALADRRIRSVPSLARDLPGLLQGWNRMRAEAGSTQPPV